MRASETKSSSIVQQRLDWICQLPKTHMAVQIGRRVRSTSTTSKKKEKKKETSEPHTASWLAGAPVDVLSVLQWMVFQHLLHNVMRDPVRAYSSPGRLALPRRPCPCITPIKGAALRPPGRHFAPGAEIIQCRGDFHLRPLFSHAVADCRLP